MALHQHLGHAGSAAQVAVDLEGWVHVPKIVSGAVFKQVAIEQIGVVSIVQSCPLVEFPTHAPAGGAIAAMSENHARGLGKFGCGERRDGRAGMKSKEVVDMAVVVVGVVDVAAPLEQLSVAAYLIGDNAVQHALPAGGFNAVYAQHFGRGYGFAQNFSSHGVGEGGALVDGAVLGRGARCGGIAAVGTVPKEIGGEFGAALDERVGYLAQVVFVAGEIVVFPKVGG